MAEVEELVELFQAKVKFDYDAEDSTELTISAHEVLSVFKVNDSGWWFAEAHDGSCGWVPSNFLVELSDGNTTEESIDIQSNVGYESSHPEEESINVKEESIGINDTEDESVHQEIESIPDGTLPMAEVGEGCAACGRVFGEQGYVLALDRRWHEECFLCSVCKISLADCGFAEIEGKLLCEDDYAASFAPKCGKCLESIVGPYVNAMDLAWHPEHFVCAECDEPFENGVFRRHEGKPYCDEHYKLLHAPKCSACDKPVTGKCFQNDGRTFHQECFRCAAGHPIEEGSTFFNHEEYLFCEEHYKQIALPQCEICSEPIEGEYFTVRKKPYHANCFQCADCTKSLTDGRFDLYEGKLLCVPCARTAKLEAVSVSKKQPETPKKLPTPQELPIPKLKVKTKEEKVDGDKAIRSAASEKRMRKRPSQFAPNLSPRAGSESMKIVPIEESIDEEQDVVEAVDVEELKPIQEFQKIEELTESSLTDSNYYSFDQIARKESTDLPPGVNPNERELSLHEDEFKTIFGMSKDEFKGLKAWRKKELRRQHDLF